ncbi:acyl carrier protein [Paucibacter sp. Y2R2-4]|uniref:acyl carrier protein n=1 Tax=Paucibacter sp. Y2R2-4 TaxID=2893553 RepID=UPI0021E4ECDF|nr:acyl carrier protein [Paucibacter sp. Y2R2-4]MCV2350874.1 acyl carrier protein [Paucibacter sp. Y2R2-4]
MTDQEIFERLRAILIETFDIDDAVIQPQARLYEDLDIDSIDAVDLIVKLRPLVGKRLQPDAFKAVRTLQDVIDALQGLIKVGESEGAEAKASTEARSALG